MPNKRVFSEQEATEIMHRAVRMQEASKTGDEYTPGVTLDELKRIAEEAGIDVRFLDKAVDGIDTEEKSTKGLFNLTEEFERVVEGEIDPEDFDKILHLIKRGLKDQVSQVGRTLTGHGSVGGIHKVHVNIESRKGRTRAKIKYSPIYAYLIGLHGPLVIAFVTLLSQIEAGRAWFGMALATGILAVGGLAFNALVKSGRAAVKKLTGQVVEVIEEEVDPLRGNLETTSTVSSENERVHERT